MTEKWRSPAALRMEILSHLEDLPIQLLALETAMEKFGADFDLAQFKRAFERKPNIEAYNNVQAVERAFSRVQNYVAQLAVSGSRLAGLELAKSHNALFARAFDALREADVVPATVVRDLQRTQKARSEIEHDYVLIKAGRVHEVVSLLVPAARAFIGPYAKWIEPYLD